jgi:hypothetical protein
VALAVVEVEVGIEEEVVGVVKTKRVDVVVLAEVVTFQSAHVPFQSSQVELTPPGWVPLYNSAVMVVVVEDVTPPLVVVLVVKKVLEVVEAAVLEVEADTEEVEFQSAQSVQFPPVPLYAVPL